MTVTTEKEDYATCPSCRNLVPRTLHCIYCGIKLPQKAVPEKRIRPESRLSLEKLIDMDSLQKTESSLLNYLLWRVRLVELLREGRVSQTVFNQIYKEYISTTLEAFDKWRASIKSISDMKDQIDDVRIKLDEMNKIKASGIQATGEFLDDYSRLKLELDQLQTELTRIRYQQRSQGLFFDEESDGEVLVAVEKRFRSYLSYLPLMVSDGLLSASMEEMVRDDLKEMLTLIEASDQGSRVIHVEEVEVVDEEPVVYDDALLNEVTSVVKGHTDEIRRIIRAIQMKDNEIARHRAAHQADVLKQARRSPGVEGLR